MAKRKFFTSRLWWWTGGILGTLVLILVLAGWLLTTDFFWQWAGPKVVDAARDRVNGELTVQRVYGNPLTALVFEKVVVTGRQGEVMRADRLEIRLSLLSFLKLEPEISRIKIIAPQMTISQDQQGRWNVTGLLKERPPPPFKILRFPDIVIAQGEVRLTRPGQKFLIHQLDLELDDLTIKNPKRPEQVIQMGRGYLAFTLPDHPRLALRTRLTLSNQQLHLDNLDIALDEQSVAAIRGTATQLDQLPRLDLTMRLQSLTGRQVRAFWPKWPIDQALTGTLHLTGDIRHLLYAGKVQLGESRIDLDGRLNYENADRLDYRLEAEFDGLSGKILQALMGKRLSFPEKLSPLSGTLTVTGTGRPGAGGSLQGRLALAPFHYNHTQVTQAHLEIHSGRNAAQEVQTQVQGNFGRLAVKAKGRLIPGLLATPGLEGKVEMEAEQFNPARLAGPQAPPGLLNGKFTGKFALPELQNLSQALVEGTLSVRGTLQDHAFQELRIQGSWQPHILKLKEAELRLGGLRAEIKGAVRGREADLKFDLRLSRSGPWPFLPAGLRGEVRAHGILRGPLAAPYIRLTARGREISWDQLRLNTLQFSAESHGYPPDTANLNLTATDLTGPGFTLSRSRLTGQARQRRLTFELRLTQHKKAAGLVAGVLDLGTTTYWLRLDTCWLGSGKNRIHSLSPILAQFLPGGVELSPATFRYRDCTINLGGRADRQSLAFRLNAEQFPVHVLNTIWPSLPALQGPLSLQTEITGSYTAPEITGRLTLSPGQITQFKFEEFAGHWRYAAGQLQVEAHLEKAAEGPRVLLDGQIPLSLSLRPVAVRGRENGLRVNLETEKLNLAFLPDLTPALEDAAGELEIRAQCTGSIKEPDLTGHLRWGSGFFKLRQAGASYALTPGELRLEKEKLTLPRLVVQSGKGTATLTGAVTLAGVQPHTVNCRLKATDFLALDRAGSQAVVNGMITLTGTWPHLEVQGRVVVPEARLRLTLFRSERNEEIRVIGPRKPAPPKPLPTVSAGDSRLWKNLTIRLDCETPGGVWVREKDLKAELSGELKIVKLPPQPLYLGGKLRVTQGGYILHRKYFKVQHAFITFPGSPEGQILLDARALHAMKDVTLIISAAGPITNFRTNLESIPPLPQSDILSYLLFDRPAAAITREQAALGILGGITTDKLKDILGGGLPLLGELSISGTEGTVGVGKKLTKDITVSYERKVDPLTSADVNQIRLDYKINKYLSAETQVGRRNSGGDLFFNLDF